MYLYVNYLLNYGLELLAELSNDVSHIYKFYKYLINM